jgi:hypothetical protein
MNEDGQRLPRHYWKGRREEYLEHRRRDDWDQTVATLIENAKRDEQATRDLLGSLAVLLREDRLPESGRRYLADTLDRIAKGGDLSDMLPKKRKRKAYTPGQILCAVEKELIRLGQERGDRLVYDSVGRKFDINWRTAQKEASIARSNLRKLAGVLTAQGYHEEWVVDAAYFNLGDLRCDLPPERVKDLLFGPLFEK